MVQNKKTVESCRVGRMERGPSIKVLGPQASAIGVPDFRGVLIALAARVGSESKGCLTAQKLQSPHLVPCSGGGLRRQAEEDCHIPKRAYQCFWGYANP